MSHVRSLFVVGATALVACQKSPIEPTGPRVDIDVAPLSLPGVRGVEYALAVFGAPPSAPVFDVDGAVVGPGNTAITVWAEPSVTSNRYGNGPGGDLTYIGTCDASVAENWVALALRQIDVGAGNGSYDGAGPFAGSGNVLDDERSAFTASPGSADGDPDFDNPCAYDEACVLKFRCAENEDTLVAFNLTIMRDAEQGFFDVAVDFEDVFCSMKIDTCYADGDDADGEPDPITLLFGADGERVPTAVIAAACTAGPGEDSVMWMAPLVVTCDDGVRFTIDPTGDSDVDPVTPGVPGNHTTDASRPGALIAAGGRATGALTFTAPAGGAGTTIAAGTPLQSADGRDYLTTAAITVDAGTSAAVAARAIDDGAVYNGTPTFGALATHDTGGAAVAIEVATEGFAGGFDAIYEEGTQVEVGYGLYWGDEQLACDEAGTSCGKIYWNVALNLTDLGDAGFENCRVATAVTASGGPALEQFVNGGLAGPGATYGFVEISAPLTEGLAPSCYQGPMGSAYAATRYGASPDMIGAEPFPHLCSFYERGAVAPRSLGDVEGYFSDTDGNPDDARYGGRFSASTPLALGFAQLGGDATGPCRSRVLDTISGAWFDGTTGVESFTWHGAWAGEGDLGAYRIEVYTRVGSGPWQIRGGYTVDLRLDEGRAFFTAGGTFAIDGDDAVALVVTRTDAPIAGPIDLTLTVGP